MSVLQVAQYVSQEFSGKRCPFNCFEGCLPSCALYLEETGECSLKAIGRLFSDLLKGD